MHVVALQFEKGLADAFATRLAAVLGITLLEARSRLSEPAGGPSVLAVFPAAAPAEAYAAELRSRGFDVFVLPPTAVETDAARLLVRTFRLGPEGLSAQSRQGRTAEVAWGDVRLLLRAVRYSQSESRRVEQKRKLSFGRAILTGGLMVTKTVRTVHRETTDESDPWLLLYPAAGPPLVFRQGDLNYAGLGRSLQPAVAANFQRLIAEVRQASPGALWDERLATRPGQARLLGPSLPIETHFDVAVSLLARTLLAAPRPDGRLPG